MNPCRYFNSCYSKISLLFDPKWCYAPCESQKAVVGPIMTGLKYVDGQLVSVKDHMASAKSTNSES